MCKAHNGHYKATGPACLRQPANVKPGTNVIVLNQPCLKVTK